MATSERGLSETFWRVIAEAVELASGMEGSASDCPGRDRGGPREYRRNRAGRRYATQQVNRAYAVLLASEFQGFCRDLYSECMDHVVATAPLTTRGVVRTQFL